MFFRLLNEHLTLFFENKKSLKEGFKVEKEIQKAVEEAKKIAEKKATNESELTKGLKRQL